MVTGEPGGTVVYLVIDMIAQRIIIEIRGSCVDKAKESVGYFEMKEYTAEVYLSNKDVIRRRQELRRASHLNWHRMLSSI